MRQKIFKLIFIVIIFLPLIMWMAWVITPKTKLVVAIIDKTVLTKEGQEHISLNWILNHERYTKTTKDAYDISHDYYGFFPQKDEKFRIKGLERFSKNQLEQLSLDADMVYFTDTYGIYNNEWFKKEDVGERSGMLYGGLSSKDIELLRLMKEKKKLIITEFNTIGSPTQSENRNQFENMFQLKWTGWTARYFDNLDISINKEIPQWLIRNYENTHKRKWPFTKSGIAFVNDKDEVVILQKDEHLTESLPHIVSNDYAQEHLSLPEKIKYPFWFDIMVPNLEVNDVVSKFEISANNAGKNELKKYGIPTTFPAVTMHKDQDYIFYYFSGDFSDNAVNITSSYFKGIGFFEGFFYNEQDALERKSFFWKFYRPMLSEILEDYNQNLHD